MTKMEVSKSRSLYVQVSKQKKGRKWRNPCAIAAKTAHVVSEREVCLSGSTPSSSATQQT